MDSKGETAVREIVEVKGGAQHGQDTDSLQRTASNEHLQLDDNVHSDAEMRRPTTQPFISANHVLPSVHQAGSKSKSMSIDNPSMDGVTDPTRQPRRISLPRNLSNRGAPYSRLASVEGMPHSLMTDENSDDDRRTTTKEIGVLGYRVGILEENQSQHLLPSLETISDLKNQIETLERLVQELANSTGQQNVLTKLSIATHKKKLMGAYVALEEAERDTPNGEAESARVAAAVDQAREQIYNSATAILELTVEENLGKTKHQLFETQINGLKTQLSATIRTLKTVKPTPYWTLRSFWATDKNAQASLSVQNLARNPAFASANLGVQTKEQLEINAKILRLMTYAMYALATFDKASVSDPDSTTAVPELYQSPARGVRDSLQVTSSGSRSARKGSSVPSSLSYAKGVNESVIDAIRFDLDKIQQEAGGLIGSPNPNRQFWGKVLMVLALAIATTVAAVAVMSMLGVATPAFLVPYLAAIQASSMVSTVLNFVAAKLTLDLNTAAAVTAVATAGAFGVFGKAVHYSGAPTQLKRDLDRAAQDLEAALAETPAGLSMS